MNSNEVEIRKSAEENVEAEPFEPVRPKNGYVVFKDGHRYFYHVHRRLKKKLNTHRWHVRRSAGRMPRPETFQAVAERNTITPNAFKKLVAKAFWTQQIIWPEKQDGIYFRVKRPPPRCLLPRDACRRRRVEREQLNVLKEIENNEASQVASGNRLQLPRIAAYRSTTG